MGREGDACCNDIVTRCNNIDTCCNNIDTCCKNVDTCCNNENAFCDNAETCCNSVDMCCNNVDTYCNNADIFCNNVEWNTLPIYDVRPRGGFMPLVHEVDVRKYNERESDKGKTHNVGFVNDGNDQVTATF